MFVISISIFFYFLSLMLFSLVNNVIYYCGLLVFNALMCGLICYLVFGFSWYSLLFCLVYIGGVYILFIFVSVFSPNNSFVVFVKFSVVGVIMIFFCFCVVFWVINYCVVNMEFSHYLCNIVEGEFYIVMCLALIFGFAVLSMIMSVKSNYYR